MALKSRIHPESTSTINQRSFEKTSQSNSSTRREIRDSLTKPTSLSLKCLKEQSKMTHTYLQIKLKIDKHLKYLLYNLTYIISSFTGHFRCEFEQENYMKIGSNL